MRSPLTIFTILAVLIAIQASPQPTTSPESKDNKNQPYANVFKPLDGRWKGKFYVYTLLSKPKKPEAQPRQITLQYLKNLPLKQTQVIEVEQIYKSKTPYHQRVTIKDTYLDKTNKKKTIISKGLNKVENGQLICIVHKPDETVIHTGKLEAPHTILWQRTTKNPFRIEFFKETVKKNTYTILGWGYYGNDNPHHPPKTWFLGQYTRVK